MIAATTQVLPPASARICDVTATPTPVRFTIATKTCAATSRMPTITTPRPPSRSARSTVRTTSPVVPPPVRVATAKARTMPIMP